MARKTLQSDDGRHVQFGEQDTVTMPEDFTAPDTGAFCPQWFGRVMENDGDGAYIEQDGE